ncbi:unnamed protein product [Toxocara canis]|uniref:HNHc domain-containing protein n=1 Tax=Toxocara canis TaxID=6265 RepID=A0A183UCQ4_TOXCA|nr:unnamed protein product [Toxocara canis]
MKRPESNRKRTIWISSHCGGPIGGHHALRVTGDRQRRIALQLGNVLMSRSDHNANTFSNVMLRRDAAKALRMKDDMMAPPRCKLKAEELGLTQENDWKDYFARDEPFHEID